MSAGGGNSYLGDGLSEELSTKLAQIPGLRVAARTSAFEFKGRNLDVRKIGQLLGVRHVLEGSVRRNGDDVRVTVQLIDTATGYHVWAGNFDRAWRDVLELQDDIALSVTDALQVVLKDTDHGRDAGKEHQLDTRAIDPYLAGLGALRQPGDLSRLQQAETVVQGGDRHRSRVRRSLCRTLPDVCPAVRSHARPSGAGIRGYGLSQGPCAGRNPRSRRKRRSRALRWHSGKFESARTVYARLVERNPRDADAYIGLGDVLAGLGKGAEAEASYRQAVTAEPAYWGAHSALATHLFQRGKIVEATAALRKVTELVPSSAFAWSNLGAALQMEGDFDRALAAYDRSLQLEPSKDAYSNLATTYYYLGRFSIGVQAYERAADARRARPHDPGQPRRCACGRSKAAATKLRRSIAGRSSWRSRNWWRRPATPTLKAQLGYYYGRLGEDERSQRYLAEALSGGPEMVYVQYFIGVAAADRDDRQTALKSIAELVRMGYPPALLRSAPEFRSLAQDAGFKRTVGAG